MNCPRCNSPVLTGKESCPNCGMLLTNLSAQNSFSAVSSSLSSIQEQRGLPERIQEIFKNRKVLFASIGILITGLLLIGAIIIFSKKQSTDLSSNIPLISTNSELTAKITEPTDGEQLDSEKPISIEGTAKAPKLVYYELKFQKERFPGDKYPSVDTEGEPFYAGHKNIENAVLGEWNARGIRGQGNSEGSYYNITLTVEDLSGSTAKDTVRVFVSDVNKTIPDDDNPIVKPTGFRCPSRYYHPYVSYSSPEKCDFQCDYNSDCFVDQSCVNHVCVAGNPKTNSCTNNYDCNIGWCYSGVCRKGGELGDSCTPYYNTRPDLRCKKGLYCVDNICKTSGAEGDSCDDRLGDTCQTGLACRYGICTSNWGNVGDKCASGCKTSECIRMAYMCDSAKGTICEDGECVKQ